jgi:reactive chlorine resistance protein C
MHLTSIGDDPGRFRPCIRGVHPFRERTISNIFDIANQHLYLTMNQTITHAEPALKTVPRMITRIFEIAARADRAGVLVTRIGLIVVLLWIGGLKAFKYEAQGIVPFVANSPLMSFFYADPGHYKAHMNPEGTFVPANVEWNEKNQTYAFAYGLGAVIVLYGLMLSLHPWLPQVAALGGFLVFVMSLVTLSFLVTTPACWVLPLGDVNHGFPFLSGAGRLVIKDAIMMGAALVVMADSAKAWLRKQRRPALD